MEDSLSAVEDIMRNAPTVPTHPSQDLPASPSDEIKRETLTVPSHPSQDVPSSPAEEAARQASLTPSHPESRRNLLLHQRKEYQDQLQDLLVLET